MAVALRIMAEILMMEMWSGCRVKRGHRMGIFPAAPSKSRAHFPRPFGELLSWKFNNYRFENLIRSSRLSQTAEYFRNINAIFQDLETFAIRGLPRNGVGTPYVDYCPSWAKNAFRNPEEDEEGTGDRFCDGLDLKSSIDKWCSTAGTSTLTWSLSRWTSCEQTTSIIVAKSRTPRLLNVD